MTQIRKLLSFGMAVGLVALPVYPAQNQSTGVVVDANGASVGDAPISEGASLFPGDLVSTDSEGHAQMRVRQTRFELIGQSTGAFFTTPNGAVAVLRHGTLVVALNSASEVFEIFASDVRIVPKGSGPILAQITMNSDCDLQIKVTHGTVEATAGKETKTLEESHAYDVIPEVSVNDTRNPAVSPDEDNFHRGHTHATCALAAKWDPKLPAAGLTHFKIIVGAVAAGILIPILLHTTGQGNAPESPFVP
jgi:hypothetical protein